MRDLLLIAVIGFCALIAVRRPVFGMLAFVFFSLFNPQSYTWGRFPFAQTIALGMFVGFVFWDEPKRLPIKRETLLIFALWGMFFISNAFADYPVDAWRKTNYVSKIFIMILFSTVLINNRKRLLYLMRVIALPLGFYAIKGGVFFLISGGTQRVWGPEKSYLYSNNAIGLAMAMNIPILFFLARIEDRRPVAWLLRFMLAMSYFSILGTFSRGAWLGAAAATVLVIWNSKYRVVAVAILVLIGLVLVPLAPERVVQRFNELEDPTDDSAQSRLWSWRFAYRVALANPLTGAGFNYYGVPAYMKYWPEMLERWPNSQGWSCHSIWFSVLSEHGFTGLMIWLCLIGSVFLSLRKIESRSRSQPGLQWAAEYARMVQIAVVAFLVSGTFLDAAYFEVFYQLVAVAIIIQQLATEQAPEQNPRQSAGAVGGPTRQATRALSSALNSTSRTG